jgi:hypothetical protein
MWTSTIPDDPVVGRWWAERDQDRQVADDRSSAGVPDRPEWRVPALAARVRRAIRDVDAALIAACDCGYSNGCRWCRPGVD